MVTIEDLWQTHPDRLRFLFSALDLSNPQLSEVQSSLQSNDTLSAAQLLLEHFKNADRNWVITTVDPLPNEVSLGLANLLIHDSVSVSAGKDLIPKTEDGGWHWDHTGPAQDEEFGYGLNGHKYLPALYFTWRNSGDDKYVKAFDAIIKDWVKQHSLPAPGDSIYLVLENKHGLDYRDLGEVEWRTLEAGNRLGASWCQLFYGFQNASSFSPATRLLMLSSIEEQATFLLNYHKKGHNWTTMEMNGLALAGLAFPEFKRAEEWSTYALNTMTHEINRQVYPDGVQSEISTKTQWVALFRFETLAENFKKAGKKISQAYLKRVEELYNYLAYSMRPDGHQPLNNDSDREDLRPRVLQAAEKFNRPDWIYIATNGKAGVKPDSLPSVVFPWGGMNIMRNGWDSLAHWSFFDAGPFGTGHQHADKLHLSISAFGKDLLVDGGRYTHQDYFSFDPTIWRGYFRSSFSHNVILIDGKGQNGGPTMATDPLKPDVDYGHVQEFDFAKGTFSDGFEEVEGKVSHSRSVIYLRDRYWVVVDQMETSQPRDLQVLWHYAPSCKVELNGLQAVSKNPGEANLRILPIGNMSWDTEIISGQETPVKQGWYSESYGKKVPNPTVTYSGTIDGPAIFAWLLVPSIGEVPEFSAVMLEESDRLRITIKSRGQKTVTITYPKKGRPSVQF